MSSGFCVIWSLRKSTSFAEKPPRFLTLLLSMCTASWRVTSETGLPLGSIRRSSASSSRLHFSATGFLFAFLMRPKSTDIPCAERISSCRRGRNPGALSILTVHDGARRLDVQQINAVRSVSDRSSSIILAEVNDVWISREVKMSCTETTLTTELMVSSTKLHIWHPGS